MCAQRLYASLLALSLPLAAWAEPPTGHHLASLAPPDALAEPPLFSTARLEPRFLQQLDLSDAQQDAVFEILHQHAPEFWQLRRTLRQAHRDLRRLNLAESVDAAQIQTSIDRIGQTAAALARLQVTSDRQLYELLTPEQRQQVRDRPALRSARHHPSAENASPDMPPVVPSPVIPLDCSDTSKPCQDD